LRSNVAGDAAGERELAEEAPQALFVLGDVRIDLTVRAFHVDVGQGSRSPVARARDVHRVERARLDNAVEVDIDEVQARRGAPVAQQPGLDVLQGQRLPQQWIIEQVDLTD